MTEKTPISNLLLERYVLGEVSTDEKQRVESLLRAEGNSGPIHEAIAELHRSDAEISAEYPADVFVPNIVRKTSASNVTPIRRIPAPAWAGLAAASLLAAFAPVLLNRVRSTETERTKGLSSSLRIYRQFGSQPMPLSAKAIVRPGDKLQIAYVSAGEKFGAILSIDGRGNITQHFPGGNARRSGALSAEGEIQLPESFVLDDAPDFETFFWITSNQEFELENAMRAIRERRPSMPVVMPGAKVTEFPLLKAPSPKKAPRK